MSSSFSLLSSSGLKPICQNNPLAISVRLKYLSPALYLKVVSMVDGRVFLEASKKLDLVFFNSFC